MCLTIAARDSCGAAGCRARHLHLSQSRFCAMACREFADDAAAAGADGVLITDMIVEEAGEYLAEMDRVGSCAGFSGRAHQPRRTPRGHRDTRAKGFIYAISRVGITGKQQNITADAASLVARIRRWTTLPVAVGFGISNRGACRPGGGVRGCRGHRQRDCGVDRAIDTGAAPGAVARFIKGLRLPEAALAR